MFFTHCTPLVPLPPPAPLKLVAKLVRGVFTGVGGSEVFRQGSCSPEKACSLSVGALKGAATTWG